MKIILAFDVFGTLLDTSSFPEEARRKQLEYTWLFTVMGKFLPFREITSMAVRSYLNEHEGSEPKLMEIWRNLKAHSDVSSLAEISSLAEVFALSNGSVEEVREHLERNGILKYFKGIYSAEQVGEYKPSPKVYKFFMENEGYPSFLVSANAFDLMGARNAGMGTVYVNRGTRKLDPFLEVDVIVKDLNKLALYLREKA